MKRIVKVDAPVEPSEKQEAKSLGLDLLHILEVEVSTALSPTSAERLCNHTRRLHIIRSDPLMQQNSL